MRFKLSFNKPASQHFFEGQESGGIKIEIVNGKVRFKPVAQYSGPAIVGVTDRARGGVETRLIEGSETDNLFKALTNPLGYPFFMLNRVGDGWIEATPWDGPKKITADQPKDLKAVPDRFTPHLRVWLKGNSKSEADAGPDNIEEFPEVDPAVVNENSVRDRLRLIVDALADINSLPFGKALTQLRQAKDLISETEAPLLKAAQAQATALMGRETGDATVISEDQSAPRSEAQSTAEPVRDNTRSAHVTPRRHARIPTRLAARLGSKPGRTAQMGARG